MTIILYMAILLPTSLPQFLITQDLTQTMDYENFNKDAFKTEFDELDWFFITKNTDANLGFETLLLYFN